ncbi:MAG: porin [Gemmatimonadales bacterium]
MHTRSLVPTLVVAATVGVLAIPAFAQAPAVRVAGRAQVQYRLAGGDSTADFNDGAVNNGFEVRRLRIDASVRFGDNMSLYIQPSFEMGSLRMRDAWLRVGLTPQISLTLGQEKSPFQRYELNSSNSLPSIERGVRILGLSGREALNDLLVNNGYGSHDLGAFLDYAAPGGRYAVKAGVSNGSRESATDVNNAKSFFGRATAVLMTNADGQPRLQAGVSFAARDRAICDPTSTCTGSGADPDYFPDSSKTTTAVGVDLEWGGYRPGWHVIADFATGDNVPRARRVTSGRNVANLLNSADSNVVTFWGVHVVTAYRLNTRGPETRLVKTLEPALRVDYTDPNTHADDDEGLLITPVLNVYFASTVVLRAGLDFYRYKDAAGESRSARELKVSWQANF